VGIAALRAVSAPSKVTKPFGGANSDILIVYKHTLIELLQFLIRDAVAKSVLGIE
jgi:hypothetical protein